MANKVLINGGTDTVNGSGNASVKVAANAKNFGREAQSIGSISFTTNGADESRKNIVVAVTQDKAPIHICTKAETIPMGFEQVDRTEVAAPSAGKRIALVFYTNSPTLDIALIPKSSDKRYYSWNSQGLNTDESGNKYKDINLGTVALAVADAGSASPSTGLAPTTISATYVSYNISKYGKDKQYMYGLSFDAPSENTDDDTITRQVGIRTSESSVYIILTITQAGNLVTFKVNGKETDFDYVIDYDCVESCPVDFDVESNTAWSAEIINV